MQSSGDPARSGRSGRPPVTVHDWDDEVRHATWLELFFDLVFVAALANWEMRLGLMPGSPGVRLGPPSVAAPGTAARSPAPGAPTGERAG